MENYNHLAVLKSGGLKCDNPSCDFVDESIKREDYEQWVNAPCPKCGENLLTEEDYNNVLALQYTIEFLNTLSPEELEAFNKSLGLPESDLPDVPHIITVDTHKGINITSIKPISDKNDAVSDTTGAESSTQS